MSFKNKFGKDIKFEQIQHSRSIIMSYFVHEYCDYYFVETSFLQVVLKDNIIGSIYTISDKSGKYYSIDFNYISYTTKPLRNFGSI